MDTRQRAISKLRGLVINEVSHCDAGANFFSEVLIAKSDDTEVTATFEEFQAWIAKSDLEPDAPATDAFAQFARERAEKASPTPGSLHHDAPMGKPVKNKRDCPKCGKSVPAKSTKCLACKADLAKALPPKLKLKRKPAKPSDVAGLSEPTDDAPYDEESGASRYDITSGEKATGEEEELEDEDQEGLEYGGEEDEAPFESEDDEELGESEDGEEDGPVAEGDEIDPEFDPSKVTLPGDLPTEVGEYISSLEALIEHQESQMREQEQMTLSKANDTVTKDDLAFLQDIHKSIQDGEEVDTAALTKAFDTMSTAVTGWQSIAKAAEERAEEATTVAKTEREHRLTRERVELAKSWQALPLDAEAVGAQLFKASEALDEDTYNGLVEVFAKANEAASLGKDFTEDHPLFGEIGKTGADAQEGTDELGVLVKALKDDDPNLSTPQAINKALEQRPELYDLSLKS